MCWWIVDCGLLGGFVFIDHGPDCTEPVHELPCRIVLHGWFVPDALSHRYIFV